MFNFSIEMTNNGCDLILNERGGHRLDNLYCY